MDQNEGKMDQNGGKMEKNEGKMNLNWDKMKKVDQNEGKMTTIENMSPIWQNQLIFKIWHYSVFIQADL